MQPIDTLIPTVNGFKILEKISKGDIIFDNKGNRINVIDVSNVKSRDTYRITFSDGRSTECDSSQNWVVTSRWYRRSKAVITKVDDIAMDYKSFSESIKKHYSGKDPHNYKYKIDALDCKVDYEERKLDVDPYVMGAFVGSRDVMNGNLGIKSNDDYVPEVIAEKYGFILRRGLKDKTYLFFNNDRGINAYSFFRNYPIMVGRDLRYREIPEDYMYNTYENRIEFLKGLMDNAGYIRKSDTKRSVTFAFMSNKLIEQLKIMIMGLGFIAYDLTRIIKNNRKSIGIFFSIPNVFKTKIFTHPDKLNLAIESLSKPETKKFNNLTIKDIQPIGRKLCRSILTDSESDLYLTNDFIVTHN